jgi:hypothetical protein
VPNQVDRDPSCFPVPGTVHEFDVKPEKPTTDSSEAATAATVILEVTLANLDSNRNTVMHARAWHEQMDKGVCGALTVSS